MVLWPNIIQYNDEMPRVPLVLIKNTRTLNFAALQSSKECFNFISSNNSKSCREKSDLNHFEIL